MSDTIDRQAAIDAVANHCIAVLESHAYDSIMTNVYEMAHRHIIDVLKVFPSVQPEIIRCKDCKHRDAENGFCEGRGWPMQLVHDDGFCDKGERSEE